MAINSKTLAYQVVIDDKGSPTIKKVEKSLDGLEKKAKSIGKGVDSVFAEMMGKAKGLLATLGTLATAKAFTKLTMESAKLNATVGAMKDGLDPLLEKYGELGSSILPRLRTSTRDTVSDFELLKKMNTGLALGLDPESIVKFGEIAVTVAQRTGQEVGYMFESLVTGSARQSKLWLDNLGILIDVDQANEAYAKTLGKTVTALSEQERKQAFVNSALAKGEELTKRMGGVTNNLVTDLQKYHAQVANLKANAGDMWGGIFGPAISWAAEFTKELNSSLRAIDALDEKSNKGIMLSMAAQLGDLEKQRADWQNKLDNSGGFFGYDKDKALDEVVRLDAAIRNQRANIETLSKSIASGDGPFGKPTPGAPSAGGATSASAGRSKPGGTGKTGPDPFDDQIKQMSENLDSYNMYLYTAQANTDALATSTQAFSDAELTRLYSVAGITDQYASQSAMVASMDASMMSIAANERNQAENLQRLRVTTAALDNAWANVLSSARQVGVMITDELSNGIAEGLVEGTYDWARAMKAVLKQVIALIIKTAILNGFMLLLNIQTAGGGGMAVGGAGAGAGAGNSIGAPLHTGGGVGTIPRHHTGVMSAHDHRAVLQKGEYVMRKSAARRIGPDRLNAMNEGKPGAMGQVINMNPTINITMTGNKSPEQFAREVTPAIMREMNREARRGYKVG